MLSSFFRTFLSFLEPKQGKQPISEAPISSSSLPFPARPPAPTPAPASSCASSAASCSCATLPASPGVVPSRPRPNPGAYKPSQIAPPYPRPSSSPHARMLGYHSHPSMPAADLAPIAACIVGEASSYPKSLPACERLWNRPPEYCLTLASLGSHHCSYFSFLRSLSFVFVFGVWCLACVPVRLCVWVCDCGELHPHRSLGTEVGSVGTGSGSWCDPATTGPSGAATVWVS